MKEMKIKKAVLFVVILLASGCATDLDKKLNMKVAEEPEVSSSEELNQQTKVAINEDKNLTDDQKKKLTQLRKDTNAKLKGLREQALKLREALLSDFLAENDEEVDIIHDRLKVNYSKRLDVLFDAVSSANRIIGHVPRNRQWIDEMMLNEH
jgi:hypothetical protein